jgi:hypothetical protein
LLAVTDGVAGFASFLDEQPADAMIVVIAATAAAI